MHRFFVAALILGRQVQVRRHSSSWTGCRSSRSRWACT